MKKILFFSALLGLLAMSSCNKEEKYLLGPKNTSALVTVHAILQGTHSAVDSVMVEVVGYNSIRQTDQNGCAVFDLPVGSYELKITRNGYLGIVKDVNVEVANDQSDLPIISTQTVDVDMYPLSASLKGNTTINRQGDVTYLEGAKIEITSPNVTFISPITAESGAKGAYSVDALPEGLALNIKAVYGDGGASYSASSTINAARAGEEIVASTLQLTKSNTTEGPDIVVKPETAKSPLVLTFNMPVDVERIKDGDITVKSGGNRVGVTYAWSDNNQTLSISSADPNGWGVNGADSYEYAVSLYSVSGDELNAQGTFGLVLYSGEVANIASIQYDEAAQKLSWTKLANAEAYHIYVRADGQSDYILKHTVYADPDSQELVEEVPASSFISYAADEIYYVKVVGYNDDSTASLANAKEVRVKY